VLSTLSTLSMPSDRLWINMLGGNNARYRRNDAVLSFLRKRRVFERQGASKSVAKGTFFQIPAAAPAWPRNVVVRTLFRFSALEPASSEGTKVLDEFVYRSAP
jgi:hypothetical protein